MKYNINYYNTEKAEKRSNYFASKPIFFDKGIDTNKVFFQFINDSIESISKKKKRGKIKILDLGTGTGYVPEILCKINQAEFEITGIDLSEQMIRNAKNKINDKRMNFIIGDNNHLPFKSESFDIVTNKLSTQFSVKELFRVLKKDGYFVFKEYGQNKGFKEIREIFIRRFAKINKTPFDIYNELYKLKFSEILFKSYFLKRVYKIEEINKIFGMAGLINNFSKKDLFKIKDKLGSNLKITSDPFIIYAKK
jgi:ubiquinone/menaquinone biosynthesis C-methylase UbiE